LHSKWPSLLLVFFTAFFCACDRNTGQPGSEAPLEKVQIQEKAAASSDETSEPVSETALLVLSCPEFRPVIEKTVLRIKNDERMPPISVVYLQSEKHLGELIKGGLRYNVLLTEGKENWKLAAEHGLTREKDGISLARNGIVVAALQSREIENDNPIKFLSGLADIRIALPSPLSSLAGIHAQQSMIRMGLWKKNERRGLWLDDRSEAVAALSDGRADAAVIYRSDAVQSPGIKILFLAPDGSHFDIVYYGMHLTGSGLRDEARYFLLELSGPDSGADWKANGFLPPPPDEP